MLPLEVVGVMLTLLSFIIEPPPDPPPDPPSDIVQLINTELDSTTPTVVTVQTMSSLIPTLGSVRLLTTVTVVCPLAPESINQLYNNS